MASLSKAAPSSSTKPVLEKSVGVVLVAVAVAVAVVAVAVVAAPTVVVIFSISYQNYEICSMRLLKDTTLWLEAAFPVTVFC